MVVACASGESSTDQESQEETPTKPKKEITTTTTSTDTTPSSASAMKNNTKQRYTILEAAFHDPSAAYQVPKVSESIELRAKAKLLGNTTTIIENDDESIHSMTPSLASTIEPDYDKVEESIINEMKHDKNNSKTNKKKKWCLWNCKSKQSNDNVISNDTTEDTDTISILDVDDNNNINTITLSKEEIEKCKIKAKSQYDKDCKSKKQRYSTKLKRREKAHVAAEKKRAKLRESKKWKKLPEGVLVYRLDSSDKSISLVSPTNSQTDPDKILYSMTVCFAAASSDPSRRGIDLIGLKGEKHTLIACDQHTAITWLESLYYLTQQSSTSSWAQGQEEYLNLAKYSHSLVHQTENSKQKSTTAVYHSILVQSNPLVPTSIDTDDTNKVNEEERLEAIAKRRAIVKDSWDFYRMICSLLRDRRKYEEAFMELCTDPVYPYLQSLSGLNDQGPKGIFQKYLSKYRNMSRSDIVADQIAQASIALPSLVEICKALAGSLGMEEVGVGPIKESSSALRKADKKYGGDVLKITDYCRALLVVKDLSTLLAVLELARDSFGPLIRRVKLSSLNNSRDAALPGGYRDAKINVELKDHICEIQIHIWDMYAICGVDGYRHYRHSLEYSTDTFHDPYQALQGLETQVVAEMIVIAEETVSDVPLYNLQWFQEKYMLDYFAEVGLFLSHKLYVWAEVTLKRLIQLRIESPNIGLYHHETRQLQQYLVLALQGQQNKQNEAQELINTFNENTKIAEEQQKKTINQSLDDTTTIDNDNTWSSFLEKPMDLAIEMCSLDPNKKQRMQEEEFQNSIRTSKKCWKKQREERFTFLIENDDLDDELTFDEENDQTTAQDSFSLVSSNSRL